MLTLYHGTTEKRLKKILAQGIKPRGKKWGGNWADNPFQSRFDLVYLTTCYAAYYASMACKNKSDGKGAILKIQIDERKIKLYPDEEFLWHALDLQKVYVEKLHAKESKEQVNKWCKEIFTGINPRDYQKHWAQSLQFLGTVCASQIPTSAIVGYTLERDNLDFLMHCDPSISPMNFKFCSGMYVEHLESLKWHKP